MHHQFYFSNLVNRLLCCLFHNFICCCYYYYHWFTIQQICSVPYSIYVVIFAAWLFQQLWNCYYCRAYFFKFQLHVYTGVSYLDHVWSEVERWWKLYDLSVKSFSNVARFWCWGLGVLTVLVWGGILWGWAVTWRMLDIVFTVLVFVKESVLGGDVYFDGCYSQGSF